MPSGCQIPLETGIDALDFDRDGKADLACFGTVIGAGVGTTAAGPSAGFIRLGQTQ